MCWVGAALEDCSPGWVKMSGVWLSHGLVNPSSDMAESKEQICFAVVAKQAVGH